MNTSTSPRDGIYYRDHAKSREFVGPFDESKVQRLYRDGFFHSGVQFKLMNSSEIFTLARLRDLNGIACPFAMPGDYKEETNANIQSTEVESLKLRVKEVEEENAKMRKRIGLLEERSIEQIEKIRRNEEEMTKLIGKTNELSDEMEKNRAVAVEMSLFMAIMRSADADSSTDVESESEDEAERVVREKLEANITKRCMGDVGSFVEGEISLDASRAEIFKIEKLKRYGKPPLVIVFKCFLAAAVKKYHNDPEALSKLGYLLAYCVARKAGEKDRKEDIFKGIAEGCREIVKNEQWEDMPKIWDVVAEVLMSAHLPTERLCEGAPPLLAHFKEAFMQAAKDTRKPYTLFVLVLKQLADKHKHDYMDVCRWVWDECKSTIKQMDRDKLARALRETKTEFGKNLYEIYLQ